MSIWAEIHQPICYSEEANKVMGVMNVNERELFTLSSVIGENVIDIDRISSHCPIKVHIMDKDG